jgi:release factor glutamine methyltransferase
MESMALMVNNVILDFHQKLAGIYPEGEIRQFIYILFEEYLGWEKTKIHLSLGNELPETTRQLFYKALIELQSGKPIQYIINKSWFNSTLLKVDKGVLIPRRETEELCSIIRSDHQENQETIRILDIGTGSGCIAIDLKKHIPHAIVSAIDYSHSAVEIAKDNAMSNDCDISFTPSDILDEKGWVHLGNYDIIVSNPPYVTEGEKKLLHQNIIGFEPEMALFVPDNDPLIFYKAILNFSASSLTPGGFIYFEFNELFGKEIKQLIISAGFERVSILLDFQGKERFARAILNPSGNQWVGK